MRDEDQAGALASALGGAAALDALPPDLLQLILCRLHQRDRCAASGHGSHSSTTCVWPAQHDFAHVGVLMPTMLRSAHRLTVACLVCRQWRDACHSAEQLREVHAKVGTQQLGSLAAWLLRHGGSVRRLSLDAGHGLLAGGGGLSWCSLARLERLELEGLGPLPGSVMGGLSCLGQLASLSLAGFGDVPAGLGRRLGALPRLRCLHLGWLGGEEREADAYRVEAGLCAALAGPLARLTALGFANSVAREQCGLLSRPPPQLTRLTCLRELKLVHDWWEDGARLPLRAPGSGGGREGAAAGSGCVAAPPAWLAGLRRLHLDWRLLRANLPELAAAGTPELLCLAVSCFHGEMRRPPRHGWAWLWRFAAAHPTLRRLELIEASAAAAAGAGAAVALGRRGCCSVKAPAKARPAAAFLGRPNLPYRCASLRFPYRCGSSLRLHLCRSRST